MSGQARSFRLVCNYSNGDPLTQNRKESERWNGQEKERTLERGGVLLQEDEETLEQGELRQGDGETVKYGRESCEEDGNTEDREAIELLRDGVTEDPGDGGGR
ncbi:hypothetical protein NDU88_004789 [Pleurodeles waltl]|uniref:Uncharacterized protein n=1 Tax=Pleurodeles waltl TaxID=8319 RepID=A0AAV7WZB7_PLEWA|nr:hypothetical protein NDU88_004789 [Pleurodeles waltl]